mmetsp:Transcript_11720/g.28449  ORF Transcript_11720/g.28449 Transcript_11720/m.28449 type:complete len:242 (-) Transcript_11720:671-1396(-)
MKLFTHSTSTPATLSTSTQLGSQSSSSYFLAILERWKSYSSSSCTRISCFICAFRCSFFFLMNSTSSSCSRSSCFSSCSFRLSSCLSLSESLSSNLLRSDWSLRLVSFFSSSRCSFIRSLIRASSCFRTSASSFSCCFSLHSSTFLHIATRLSMSHFSFSDMDSSFFLFSSNFFLSSRIFSLKSRSDFSSASACRASAFSFSASSRARSFSSESCMSCWISRSRSCSRASNDSRSSFTKAS